MRVKFGNGTKDVPVTEVNAANYLLPKGEEGSYHVKQEIPYFDPRTGVRKSVPRIQKYGAKEFGTIRRNLQQQGYQLDILHDPTEWLKAKAEEQAEKEALTAQRQHELKMQRREEEKAAMKAEIIAELKAAGVIPAEGGDDNETKTKGTTKKK